jgi:DNA-binding PadR family transcriptional regulator
MSVASDLIRGHTDTIILASLRSGDNYGYKINRMIYEMTSGRYELKEATLYTAFKRLEEAGYISSYWGDEESGARRRYYTITNHGKRRYEELLAEWNEIRDVIDKLVK